MSKPEVASNAAAEGYYSELWSSEGWGSVSPNRDETDRWQAIRPLVLRAAGGVPGPRVLDVGCGRGWLTALLAAEFAERRFRILGIDPLQASIDAAGRLNPELSFRCATTRTLLKEGAAPFDLVVSSEVIEHVRDAEKPRFLADIATLLAPGGHLILTTPRGELWDAWIRRARRTQPVEEWIGEPELDALIRQAGLTVVERRRAHQPRRSYTWHGQLLGHVLERRLLRHVPLLGLRRWLRNASSLYQVVLAAKPGPAAPVHDGHQVPPAP